jgi:putative membrane protein
MMRRALLTSGLVTLAAAWLLPLEALMPGPFSAGMTRHMAVVAVAAPFIALGLAGGRYDPVRMAPGLFAPLPASVLELLVVWGWHAPALHHAAGASAAALTLEQASFLACGLLLWLAAFGGGRHLRAERRGAGVLALLLTSMHMTLLGALLALPPRVLYPSLGGAVPGVLGGAAPGVSLGGPSPGALGGYGAATLLADQHLGGAIMLAVGGASYLAGGLALTLELLRRGRARGRVTPPLPAPPSPPRRHHPAPPTRPQHPPRSAAPGRRP